MTETTRAPGGCKGVNSTWSAVSPLNGIQAQSPQNVAFLTLFEDILRPSEHHF